MFPCTAAVEIFQCCVDIHGIFSTYVENVCLLTNQNAQAKHHVNAGMDAEDYYKIKDNTKNQAVFFG